jgi:long-subunit fatty acid transport protein
MLTTSKHRGFLAFEHAVVSKINTASNTPLNTTSRKTLNTVIVVLATVCLAAGEVYCDAQGTSGAQFLEIVASPRAAALGSAFTAFADDVNSIAFNPAGLAFLKKSEVSLVQNNWIQDISNQYLAFAVPTSAGTFGLNVVLSGVSNLVRRDETGAADGSTFGSSDMSTSLAYATHINDNLSFGLNLKLISETIDTENATSIAGDFGVIYKVSPKLNLGASILNLGNSVKFLEVGDPLPLDLRAGLMYAPVDNVKIGLDVSQPNDADMNVGAGVEYSIKAGEKLVFPIRAGYRSGNETDDQLSGISAGCGVIYNETVSFDLSWVPMGILGDSMQFGLTYKF